MIIPLQWYPLFLSSSLWQLIEISWSPSQTAQRQTLTCKQLASIHVAMLITFSSLSLALSCFIGEVGVFFGAFLGPIFAILLFNLVMLFIVIFVLVRRTLGIFKHKKDRIDIKAAVLTLTTIMGVMFLFGLTWLFGAFTVADASLAFQILFVVFNSLQGFFIFLFLCIITNDARELWMAKLHCSWCKSKAPQSSYAKDTSSGTAATKKANASNQLTVSTLSGKLTSEVSLGYELPVMTTNLSELEKKDVEATTSTFNEEPRQTEGTDTNAAVIAISLTESESMVKSWVPIEVEEAAIYFIWGAKSGKKPLTFDSLLLIHLIYIWHVQLIYPDV